MGQTIGLLPLGRGTFDTRYAQEKLDAMLDTLDDAGVKTVGPRSLLMDGEAAQEAIGNLASAGIDRLLILQVTFTDAAISVEAAMRLGVPIAIWAVPEPRLGGRLRLNAFCGLNLASHALGLRGKRFGWAYGDAGSVDIASLLSDASMTSATQAQSAEISPGKEARALVEQLGNSRIARLGEHPEGFDTCRYDATALKELSGVRVDEYEISDLFSKAGTEDRSAVSRMKADLGATLADLDTVDRDQLDRSLALKLAIDRLRRDGEYDAFAIRCWPETFTEYGGAACGPVSMLGEGRIPCACEADVYGALTQIVLQRVADAPVFLADLVDIDIADGTAVVWHCGQAPISMAASDTQARATIHTNRKMPLLFEFPLKAGEVTFLRISQAHGEPKMILSHGTMLDREMAFTGTSGVVAFDTPADKMLNAVMDSGLEHHMALAYGDHRPLLREVAAAMALPVLEL